MERQNVFSVSLFLRCLYLITFFIETMYGMSYFIFEAISLWATFHAFNTFTLLFLGISASRLRKIFPNNKYTSFNFLLVVGIVIGALSDLFTITAAYLNEPLFRAIYGAYFIEELTHYVYWGIAILSNLIFFIAWMMFERYMKKKEQKKLFKMSRFVTSSILLLGIGMSIIFLKDFLFWDSKPPEINDITELFKITSLVDIYESIYLIGLLFSLIGTALYFISTLLLAFHLRVKPIPHTIEPFIWDYKSEEKNKHRNNRIRNKKKK